MFHIVLWVLREKIMVSSNFLAVLKGLVSIFWATDVFCPPSTYIIPGNYNNSRLIIVFVSINHTFCQHKHRTVL